MQLTLMAAWELRRLEQEQLAMNRLLLATVCGCTRCDDAADLERLAAEIRQSESKVAELTDAITDVPQGATCSS